MSETNDKGIKASAFAALALAFASFGDAFLYPFLPVNFESVGIPVAENATWRDLGAAMGTLIGGFLISYQYLNTVMAVAIFVLTFFCFFILARHEKPLNYTYGSSRHLQTISF
jgi:hypothetical protein